MARVRVREEGKRGGPWVSVFLGRGACLFYKHRVQISIGAGLLSAIWGGCPPTLEALSKTIVFVAWRHTITGIINNGCMPSHDHSHARALGTASISGHNGVANDQSKWRLLSFDSFGFCWHMQALITAALKGKNRKWRDAPPLPPLPTPTTIPASASASLMNPA